MDIYIHVDIFRVREQMGNYAKFAMLGKSFTRALFPKPPATHTNTDVHTPRCVHVQRSLVRD